MSPEDFTNPHHHNHPEVAGAALEMQRPGQETLRHLLADVTKFATSDDAHDLGDSTGVGLREPGSNSDHDVATVYRHQYDASSSYANRIATIKKTQTIGSNGDATITNYHISSSPDGLNIEKYTHTSNSAEERLEEDATPEDISRAAASGIARLAERRKAQADEDELGLSFVSEKEAQDLIELLAGLVPLEKK